MKLSKEELHRPGFDLEAVLSRHAELHFCSDVSVMKDEWSIWEV